MDCESCESNLLDLAYGELAPEPAAQARSHIARCAQCRGAFARVEANIGLARKLPIVEPPGALTERLMQAAAAHASQTRPSFSVRFARIWMELIGRVAMARQVAMATVTLLIVLVGLWSVPRLKHRPEATGGTVINPEHDGEAGPSAALSPAEPLDLAVDTRTGRIRRKEELDALRARAEAARASAASEVAASAAATETAAAKAEYAEAKASSRNAKRSAGTSSADDMFGAAPADSLRRAEAAAQDTHEAKGRSGVKLDSRFAPAPAARKAESAGASGKSRAASLAEESELEGIAQAAPSPAGGASVGSGGVAQPASEDSADATPASALLQAARAERALGRCEHAVLSYEKIVLQYTRSREAPTALAEAAACYDQLGQGARAQALLDRAARLPALAGGAQRLRAARQAPAAAAKPANASPDGK